MIGHPREFRCSCPPGTVCNCEWVARYGRAPYVTGSSIYLRSGLSANQQARRKAWLRGHRERQC